MKGIGKEKSGQRRNRNTEVRRHSKRRPPGIQQPPYWGPCCDRAPEGAPVTRTRVSLPDRSVTCCEGRAACGAGCQGSQSPSPGGAARRPVTAQNDAACDRRHCWSEAHHEGVVEAREDVRNPEDVLALTGAGAQGHVLLHLNAFSGAASSDGAPASADRGGSRRALGSIGPGNRASSGFFAALGAMVLTARCEREAFSQ